MNIAQSAISTPSSSPASTTIEITTERGRALGSGLVIVGYSISLRQESVITTARRSGSGLSSITIQ